MKLGGIILYPAFVKQQPAVDEGHVTSFSLVWYATTGCAPLWLDYLKTDVEFPLYLYTTTFWFLYPQSNINN